MTFLFRAKEGGAKYYLKLLLNKFKNNKFALFLRNNNSVHVIVPSLETIHETREQIEYYRPIANGARTACKRSQPFWEYSSAWLEQWSYSTLFNKGFWLSVSAPCVGGSNPPSPIARKIGRRFCPAFSGTGTIFDGALE